MNIHSASRARRIDIDLAEFSAQHKID